MLIRTSPLLALLLLGCGSKWTLLDQDGDGQSPANGDCWDRIEGPPGSGLGGADIFDGADDTPYDGFDADCAGDDDYDLDGDGWVPDAAMVGLATFGVPDSGTTHLGGGDCWDALADDELPPDFRVVAANLDVDEAGQPFTQPIAAEVHPEALDRAYDGADQNCAGDDDFDQDGDGYPTAFHKQPDGALGDDCADGSSRDAANPSGAEVAAINPGATEVWYDGTDDDCDLNDCDADGDGYAADGLGLSTCAVEDCDDTDAGRYPDPTIEEQFYNGTDDNCDPIDGDGDADGDGHWATDYLDLATPDSSVTLPTDFDDCWDDPTTTPDAYVPLPGFPDLSAAEVSPSALDRPYDDVPQDCEADADADGVADDFDWDRDGHATLSWADGEGLAGDDCVDCSADCEGATGDLATWCADLCAGDAANPAGLDPTEINPEIALDTPYDGTDADCDQWNDWDADQDAYLRTGDEAEVGTGTCGAVACGAGDCDDLVPTVHPAAADAWYSGADEDCDGRDDYDADEDGYVPDAYTGLATTYVSGSGALPDGDCDDARAAANPGVANETCSTVYDDDCDGDTNDANATGCDPFYADADADTYGDAAATACLCEASTGFPLTDSTDCDDANDAINPGEREICDAADEDEDCDGTTDDNDTNLLGSSRGYWYKDNDSDDYLPTGGSATRKCERPAAASTYQYLTTAESLGTDCNDNSASINPGATEVCDAANTDEDCDSLADDADASTSAATKTTWFLDGDADFYLVSTPSSQTVCEEPTVSDGQYIESSESLGTDCDDTSALAHPGLLEVCNDDLDNDCDGTLGTRATGGTCELLDAALADADALFTGANGAQVGHAVRIVPDLNGDGIDDLIIGAVGESTSLTNRGAAYILTNLDADLDPETDITAAASVGGRLFGAVAADRMGSAIAAGRTNAGLYADIVVGAALFDGTSPTRSNAGAFSILAGAAGNGSGTLSATGSMSGASAKDYLGFALSMDGDTDGDGRAELLVAAPQHDLAGFAGGTSSTGAGLVYLFADSVIDAATPTAASATAVLTGAASGDATGLSVDFSDIDGDGMSELLIGAPLGTGAVASSGLAYVVESTATGAITLSSSTATLLRGVAASDRAGVSVAGGGDANGDGYDDILIGADVASGGLGAAYLVVGSGSTFSTLTLSAATALFTGAASGDKAGLALDFVDDIDGDGSSEVAVGAWKANGNTGATYLFMGGSLSGTSSVSTADVTFTGDVAADRAGYSLAGQGDLNGDGRGDLVIGAPYVQEDATGSTYEGNAVIFLGLTQ